MISARVRAEPDDEHAAAASDTAAADTEMSSSKLSPALTAARNPRNYSGDEEDEVDSSPPHAASPTAAAAAAEEEEEEEDAPMRRTAASRPKRRTVVSDGDDDDEPIEIAPVRSPHFASPAPPAAAQASPPASKRLQRLKRARDEEEEEGERKQASEEEDEQAEEDDEAEESKEAPRSRSKPAAAAAAASKSSATNKRKRDALDASPESKAERDDEEYEQIDEDDDDDEEESPEPADNDSDEEEYGVASKRKQTASRASSRATRTSARESKRKIQSSSEEEEEQSAASSSASEGKPDTSDSEASVGKPKRGAAQAKKKKPAAKEAATTASSSKRTAAATKAAKPASDAPAGAGLRSFFSPQASIPGSLSAKAAAEYEIGAAKRNQERAAKKSAKLASESEVDDDDEEEEEVPRSRSGRNLRKPKPAISAPSAPPAPAGGRRSGRSATLQRPSYKEPSDRIEEVSPDAPKPKRKTITVDDDEEADANAAAAAEEDEDDAEANNSSDDAAFVKHFAQARGKAKKRSKVVVKKSLKKRRSRASGDDEDESVDSAEERAAEKAWERSNIQSDVESSDSDADDEPTDNPIDKILARRQVQIPADPTSTDKNGRTMMRMEFLVKYKDMSYAECDWVDRKTIEMWKMGKSRLSHWAKRESLEEFTCFLASTADATTNKLFKSIRAFELQVFERDEKEGIAAMMDAEETRINKRIHPSLKTILKVWAPSAAGADGSAGVGDDEEAEGAGAHLFDPAYLEVDRIVGRRMAAGFEETKGTDAAKFEYLVKWCNLSYKDLTWENSDYVGDEAPNFIPNDCVERFEKSLEFPTPEQLKISREFVISGKRPKLEVFTESNPCPPFPGGRHLRDYQIEGVNWFNVNFVKGINGILADGKTVQTCAFLRTLFSKGLRGPFLVLAPLSCTPHWQREFESWVPEMSVVSYAGTSESRDRARTYEFSWTDALGDSMTRDQESVIKSLPKKTIRANVVISSYDTMRSDLAFFKSIDWQVLVVDEAHQIKNEASKLYQCINSCTFEHKVFLTGTPIQNNLGELFTLLQMIDRSTFPSRDDFVAKYKDLQTTGTSKDVTDLHNVIRPYMFRRMKGDVEKSLPPREETLIEVEMTSLQKQYYRAVFERNVDFLAGKDGNKKTVASLMNVAMQLRKVCNHPYLLEGVENSQIVEHNFDNYLSDSAMQHMIACSGKLVLIDKLLTKLKAEGKQVLIFSQMVRALDVIEDYLNWRGWKHERLDGSTAGAHRQASIDRFSRKGSDRFVFMLSTKAGGIGINLTAASTVIIFDSDPCPQGDVQAMARAHRIGQKEKVSVYRLICSGTYESELFEKANMKLGLDQAVLHTMDKNSTMKMDKKEVESLLRKGAAYMLRADDAKAEAFCAADIDTILSKNARTINFDQPTVGAASARSGLSSFTHATFNAGAAGEQDVRFDDPLFWDKIGVQSEAKKAKHVASKRAHKQMFDLKKVGGRGDQDDADEAPEPQDWCGASDESADDEEGEGKKKKKRGGKAQDDDLVVVEEPDDDERERFYEAAWSRRQRERFLAALHRYGYHRLTELKPYFPNQNLREMKSLALSYIVFLALKQKGSKASTLASTLMGVVREDMLVQLDEHWKRKEHDSGEQAPRYHMKPFDDLLQSYVPCFEPCINDPTFIDQYEQKTAKSLLQDLNRLAVLHYQFAAPKPQQPATASVTVDLSNESQSPEPPKENGAAASSAAAASAVPAVPNPDEIDTTRYVNLPVTLATNLQPLHASITSHKDKDTPADWWVGEVHDPALLLGVRALGYQSNLKGARKLWDELRYQGGLAFMTMEFGKAKPKPRKSKEQKELEKKEAERKAAEGDKPEAMQIDGADNSVDSADAVMLAAPPAPAASTDAPVAAAAATDATAAASSAAAPSADPASDAPELKVWPTAMRLKNRFAFLMSQLEKTQRSKLPKPTGSMARAKPLPASSSASAKGVKSESSQEAFQLPAAVFTWSATRVKAVVKAVERHGVPINREFILPAEYFAQRSNIASATVKTEDAPMADDTPAAASAAFHSLNDDWARFRQQAFGKDQSTVPLDKLQELVAQMMTHARGVADTLAKASKEKKEELKAELREKKKQTGAARTADVQEMLAAELHVNTAKKWLEHSALLADLKAVLLDCPDVRSSLVGVTLVPLPFPTYRPLVDDAALLVGILKHGFSLAAAPKMHEDPCISVFKSLKPEVKKTKEPKAADSKATEVKSEAKSDAIDVDGADAAAAASSSAAAVKKEKAEPKAIMDWHMPLLTNRVKTLIAHLRSRQDKRGGASASSSSAAVNSSLSAPHSPLSKPARSPSQLSDSPAKVTHQKTLGSRFHVKDELVLDEPPKAAKQKSPHKLTPPSSVKKEKKKAAAAASATKTATPKKALGDKMSAAAQPAAAAKKTSPFKPLPATTHVHTKFNPAEHGEDIEDDFEVSPDEPNAKKQRTEAAPSSSPKGASSKLVSAVVDVDDDFDPLSPAPGVAAAAAATPSSKPAARPSLSDDEIEMLSPPPGAKKARTENGSKVTAAKPAAAVTPSPAKKPSSSDSSAKSKPKSSAAPSKSAAASSSGKKKDKSAPPANNSMIKSFFAITSVSSIPLKPITAPPKSAAASAAAASASPAAAKQKPEVMSIDDE